MNSTRALGASSVAGLRDGSRVPGFEEDLSALADLCRSCHQCGRCRSACPLGADLSAGPRAVVQMVLSQDAGRLLACEDVWRCSDCGACTRACPMGVDVAGVVAGVRRLQLKHGGQRCPERSGAEIAARRLRRRPALGGVALGLAMAARGHLPWDRAGAVRIGLRSLRPAAGRSGRPAPGAGAAGEARAFFPGCGLRLDPGSFAALRAAASGAGVILDEPAEARCCGHPAREAVSAPPPDEAGVLTACPACERALARSGTPTRALWGLLVERARGGECRLIAGASRFVPYAGCLSDGAATLAMMAEAAELAGAECVTAQPSLHTTCCGGLGGAYRPPTRGVGELVALAADRQAPVVTTCLLCRDNVASAARRAGSTVAVHFWPEFFQVAGPGATLAAHGRAEP